MFHKLIIICHFFSLGKKKVEKSEKESKGKHNKFICVFLKKIKAVYKSKDTNIIEYIKISVNIQKL